jgi:hypothetical protein
VKFFATAFTKILINCIISLGYCREKFHENAKKKPFVSILEMPECRNTGKKVSPASLVLPLVRIVSPASVFRHRRQSGTAGHGIFR